MESSSESIKSIKNTTETIQGGIIDVKSNLSELQNLIIKENGNHVQGDAGISNINQQVEALEQQLRVLSVKFDIWQANVEPMIATSQTAVSHSTYILTVLAVAIAVFTVFFQKWLNKSRDEDIEEAIKAIENTIAKGILPDGEIKNKLVKTLIQTPAFAEAVRKATDYVEKSEKAEGETISGITAEKVNIKNIEDAEKQQESDLNTKS